MRGGVWVRMGPGLLVLSLGLGSMPAGAVRAVTVADPLAVVLRPSEVPKGFVQISKRDLTTLEAAHALNEPVARYGSEGHVQTAFVEFEQLAGNGANVITAYVATFRTPAKAHQAYLTEARSGAARSYSPLKFAMIGQESFGDTLTAGTMLTATAVFRRDGYLVLMAVQSIGGSAGTARAVALTRIIDMHIVHPATAASGVSPTATVTSTALGSPLPNATATSTPSAG